MTWRKELETTLSEVISSTAEEKVESYRQNAIDLLCKHSALKKLLVTSDKWHLYSLTSGYPYDTKRLKSELIDCTLKVAEKTSVGDAVRTCDKLLTDATDHKLPGFEFTFFIGIKLTKRWDITPGLYAIPYKSFQQQFGKRRALSYDPIMSKLDPKDEKDITVLVSELRWGPIIVSSSDKTLEDPWPIETVYTYSNYNPFTLIALLGIALNYPLRIVANALRAASWVDDFLDRPSGNGTYFYPENRIDPIKGIEVTAQNQKTIEKALKDWKCFANADRNSLILAITRLSASLSRSGTFAEQDKVLDISIALEILYRLDRNEITHKLSTRAGWYLGSDASERLQIKKTISDFYGFRSAIIHGRRINKSDRNSNIRGQVFDIARETLLKHLSGGNMPDDQNWNKIVMGQKNLDKN